MIGHTSVRSLLILGVSSVLPLAWGCQDEERAPVLVNTGNDRSTGGGSIGGAGGATTDPAGPSEPGSTRPDSSGIVWSVGIPGVPVGVLLYPEDPGQQVFAHGWTFDFWGRADGAIYYRYTSIEDGVDQILTVRDDSDHDECSLLNAEYDFRENDVEAASLVGCPGIIEYRPTRIGGARSFAYTCGDEWLTLDGMTLDVGELADVEVLAFSDHFILVEPALSGAPYILDSDSGEVIEFDYATKDVEPHFANLAAANPVADGFVYVSLKGTYHVDASDGVVTELGSFEGDIQGLPMVAYQDGSHYRKVYDVNDVVYLATPGEELGRITPDYSCSFTVNRPIFTYR